MQFTANPSVARRGDAGHASTSRRMNTAKAMTSAAADQRDKTDREKGRLMPSIRIGAPDRQSVSCRLVKARYLRVVQDGASWTSRLPAITAASMIPMLAAVL